MRKGQVTLFVILAIVVLAIVIVIFAFPSVNVFSTEVNPSSYLRSCISPEIEVIKKVLGENGGYTTPTNYATYNGMKFQYLCYTSENYIPCTIQQPLLLKKVNDEIKKYIEPRARRCVEDLKSQYERKGYDVRSGTSQVNVSVVPGKIIVDFLSPLTISKESTQTFQKFGVSEDSEWYDLINIAVNIIQYEAIYGDSDINLYLAYYPNLKIEKTRRDDGTNIYKLEDVVSGEEFNFATRSLVWPQGLI